MSNNLPSTKQLQRAIEISEQIEKLEAALKTALSGANGAPIAIAARTSSPVKRKGKRTMSPEARARIAAAQRARWAKARGGKAAKSPVSGVQAKAVSASSAKGSKKGKRKVSAVARARMAAAAKKRWAKVKRSKA